MDNIQILILLAVFLVVIIVILLFKAKNNQGIPLFMINQQYVPKDIYKKLEEKWLRRKRL